MTMCIYIYIYIICIYIYIYIHISVYIPWLFILPECRYATTPASYDGKTITPAVPAARHTTTFSHAFRYLVLVLLVLQNTIALVPKVH